VIHKHKMNTEMVIHKHKMNTEMGRKRTFLCFTFSSLFLVVYISGIISIYRKGKPNTILGLCRILP
jgi:hypothetical protein